MVLHREMHATLCGCKAGQVKIIFKIAHLQWKGHNCTTYFLFPAAKLHFFSYPIRKWHCTKERIHSQRKGRIERMKWGFSGAFSHLILNTWLLKTVSWAESDQALRSEPSPNPPSTSHVCPVQKTGWLGRWTHLCSVTYTPALRKPDNPNSVLQQAERPYKSPDQLHRNKTRETFPSGSSERAAQLKFNPEHPWPWSSINDSPIKGSQRHKDLK